MVHMHKDVDLPCNLPLLPKFDGVCDLNTSSDRHNIQFASFLKHMLIWTTKEEGGLFVSMWHV